MKRRQFLKGAGIGAGAAVAASVAAPAIVSAQESLNWRMVMPWPKGTPGLGTNAEKFAAMVKEMSNGRLSISVFGAGEIVPPFECMDAVEQGVVEMAHGTPYYWQGKNPALNFFSTIPFGLTAWELSAWLRFGGGQELWEEAYAEFNVVPFYAGNSGMQAGGWFNKEINSVEDLKGLKARYAGLGGEAMRRLGANITMLPPGEILPAMQSGAIDAAEWVGPWNDLAFGLYQVAKFYYTPAFHEPGPGLEIFISKEKFDALGTDLQAIIRYAAQAIAENTLADFTYNNLQSYQPLIDKGVEVRQFSDDVILALAEQSNAAVEEIAAKNDLSGRIAESYLALVKKAARYGKEFEATGLLQRAKVWGY
ncbi:MULTISPECIES: TRAP transporter substrate-binding protein [Thalassospira]|uniref:Tat (Twin-arginine translocation) pathway signal sequence n=1 Tax=Thalassospira xiamenensis TaxID=220697 RepID=A0A285TQP2_9PROT|nr:MULTISPECIES: TRAP transporter substrate-binding protein [Thalassospira]MAZ32855.1 ABC transporter substrate-binding protein [Thalassospira sp.]SOC23233.1 Tat (twin-arginine translocation) pathway signal sequence [Thalassospira xiamenensis]